MSLVKFKFVDYIDWIREMTVSPPTHFSVSVKFVFVVLCSLNMVNLVEEVKDVESINIGE